MGFSHTREIPPNEKMNESAIHKMTVFARNVAILLKIVEIVVGQDSSSNKERVKLECFRGKGRSVNSD